MAKNYLGFVYLHLAALCVIAAASAELNLLGGLPWFITIILTFISLFGIFLTGPGSPIQYLFFVAFAAFIGQSEHAFVELDSQKGVLTDILITVASIFAAMTALGFIDQQNLLGVGPYLFAGLVGLILAQVAVFLYQYFGGQSEAVNVDTTWKWLAAFGAALFTVYIAYDTQRLKRDAAYSKTPNYPRDSLSLFLDIVNLFNDLSILQR